MLYLRCTVNDSCVTVTALASRSGRPAKIGGYCPGANALGHQANRSSRLTTKKSQADERKKSHTQHIEFISFIELCMMDGVHAWHFSSSRRFLGGVETRKQCCKETSNQQGRFGDEPSPRREYAHSGCLKQRKPTTGFHCGSKKISLQQSSN